MYYQLKIRDYGNLEKALASIPLETTQLDLSWNALGSKPPTEIAQIFSTLRTLPVTALDIRFNGLKDGFFTLREILNELEGTSITSIISSYDCLACLTDVQLTDIFRDTQLESFGLCFYCFPDEASVGAYTRIFSALKGTPIRKVELYGIGPHLNYRTVFAYYHQNRTDVKLTTIFSSLANTSVSCIDLTECVNVYSYMQQMMICYFLPMSIKKVILTDVSLEGNTLHMARLIGEILNEIDSEIDRLIPQKIEGVNLLVKWGVKKPSNLKIRALNNFKYLFEAPINENSQLAEKFTTWKQNIEPMLIEQRNKITLFNPAVTKTHNTVLNIINSKMACLLTLMANKSDNIYPQPNRMVSAKTNEFSTVPL